MSAIHLVNSLSDGSVAEFRLFLGTHQIARLGVAGGATASVPTTSSFTAQAFTTLGEFSLMSNVVTFEGTSANLLAQMLVENGYYDFQLQLSPATELSAIVVENTWRNAVQFKLIMPNSPGSIVTVVNQHETETINTAQEWSIYAIVNGITTEPVKVTNPNATVTVTAANVDDSYALVVS